MRTSFTLVTWVLICVAMFPASVAAERQFDFRDTTLENGLRVVTLEDFSCPIVTVQVWYGVGSKDENPNRQGFAHMFEHMMFRGTDNLAPEGYFDLINTVGGSLNGTTSFDRTNYYETVPVNQIELALWLEAERMMFLNITEEGFETERAVVEEERRQILNAPYGTLFEQLLPVVFTEHPYRWSPIGRIAHLRAAKLEELRHFWDTYYVPSNATLLIVGAISHGDAMKLVQGYFGWMPKLPPAPKITLREPKQTELRTLQIRERLGPVAAVAFAFRGVPEKHPDTIPLLLALDILSGGESSRLYTDLVREKKLAVQLVPIFQPLQQDGVYILGAAMSPFGKPDKGPLFDALEEHFVRLVRDGVTDSELYKAKNRMSRKVVTSQLSISNKARAIGNAIIAHGTPEALNEELDKIAAATREDLQRVAATYFLPERRTDVSITPDPQYMYDPNKGWRPEDYTPPPHEYAKEGIERPAHWPSEAPLRDVQGSIPEISHEITVLDNGLKVVAVPNHEVPFATVVLGLKYGAWTDRAKSPGVASMTLGMLTQGTAGHTAIEMAEALESEALTLEGTASRDMSRVSATALADKLPLAMELMAEVVLTPAFPEDELKTYKHTLKGDLSIQSKDPKYLVTRQLRRVVYGKHPYSRSPRGELEDVEEITREELVNWWSTFARPDMAVLYIAGDVTTEKAFALAKENFGSWRASKKRPKAKLPKLPARQVTHIYLVHEPNAVQSEIRVAQLSFGMHDPDYYLGRVFNNVFGGSFGSRLNKVLRVERGLTYGARGGTFPNRMDGIFSAQTFTKTESTAETLEAVLEVIESMEAVAPTEIEMHTAKSALVGRMAGSFETPQAMADHLWDMEWHEVPEGHLERYLRAVKGAESADVHRFAREHIDRDKLTIVVLGDADKVREDLEKIAQVTVVN